jgi:DNA helicase-2/ATP-dependent DNA helicase PcrA
MTRSVFGDTNVAMPSRYLQEIPAELIDWKQSPGDATSRGGLRPRSLNSPRGALGGGTQRFSYSSSLPTTPRAKTEWTSPVTNKVRDNGDLTLAAGDRIRHADFGEGRVTEVTGVGPKSVAEVMFESAGRKRLLIKIAPIEKLA